MRKKIENKINEIIESIIAKDPKDISYNEYRILDNRLTAIKWEEDQKLKNKELAEMMGKTFGYNFATIPTQLPDE